MKSISDLKIAIHHREKSFSGRWIEYCQENKIEYKIVDCYENNIIRELDDWDCLMWHWHHEDPKAVLFAKQLIYSIQASGKKVFPDANCCWHFDDKVGQKYLLEAIRAPLVETYVFYDLHTALEFVGKTTYPKVFKLRGGAGALNVKLVKDKSEARKLVKTAFRGGFKKTDSFSLLKDRLLYLKKGRTLAAFWGCLKGLARVLISTRYEKVTGLEKGYIYFQEFIPDNDFDVRVIIIGDKAIAVKRLVRPQDFRASGSGEIVYDPDQIPEECISIGFNTAKKMAAMTVAFDFVILKNQPKIVEVSYGFRSDAYLACPGYWDQSLNFFKAPVVAEHFIIESFLKSVVGKGCNR